MAKHTHKRDEGGDPTPLLRVIMPRCPYCDSKKLNTYSRRHHPHFEMRYCRCDVCNRHVNLRIEYPLTREVG